MGHDIYAFRSKDHEKEWKFNPTVPHYGAQAYLRRSAFDRMNGTIYAALNCEQHNGGVSGCGTEQYFTRDEIKLALARLRDVKGADYEREFLETCLLHRGDGVLIHFG